MVGPALRISVQQEDLTKLTRKLKTLEGGALLKAELVRNMRAVVKPAVDEIKASISSVKRESSTAVRSLSKYHGPESAISLGAAIAKGISTSVRLSGAKTGVSIKASKKGMPRGFVNAPKRFNRQKFRHKVFGRDVWVDQVGLPDFFDGPIRKRRAEMRAAVLAAMEATKARIAGKG